MKISGFLSWPSRPAELPGGQEPEITGALLLFRRATREGDQPGLEETFYHFRGEKGV